MDGSTGNRDRPRGLTRRSFLGGIGAGFLAGTTAGCVTQESGDGAVHEDPSAFAIPLQSQPSNVFLSPWSAQYPSGIDTLFFESPSVSTPSGERFLTDLVEDVSTDGDTATVTYAEDFRWWNGDPVTARDRWVDERIQSFVTNLGGRLRTPDDTPGEVGTAHPGGASVRSVTLQDEYTVEYEFERPLSRSLALDRVLSQPHNVAAWRFEPWLQRLTDATTDAQVSSIARSLRQDDLSLEAAMDEGYGTGPYELVEVSINRVVLDPFPEHPRAEDLSIPRVWLPVGFSQQTRALVREGVIDGRTGRLDTRPVAPPDYIEQLATFHAGIGTKLVCNWNNSHLGDRNVRRALLCVLPLDQVSTMGEFGEPATVQTGLTIPPRRRWLDDSFVSSLYRYPVERDDEAAAEFMRRGGYQHDGGHWRDDDGNTASFSIRAPVGVAWGAATRRMSNVFDDFGFDVTYDQFENTTFVSYVLDGNFGLAPWFREGRPRAAYAVTDAATSTLGSGLDGSGGSSVYGKRTEVTTPTTPGDVSAGGAARESLDLGAQWRRIRRPTGEPETVDAIERIAAWWNADLPDIDLGTIRTGVWGNTRDFSWPDAGDAGYRRSGTDNRPELALVTAGRIRPTDE